MYLFIGLSVAVCECVSGISPNLIFGNCSLILVFFPYLQVMVHQNGRDKSSSELKFVMLTYGLRHPCSIGSIKCPIIRLCAQAMEAMESYLGQIESNVDLTG